MSVVVYDGQSIAADMQGTSYYFKSLMSKVSRISLNNRDYIMGWVGPQAAGLMLQRWWIEGQHPDRYPLCQADKDQWGRLVVVDVQTREIVQYECHPVPLPVIDPFCAWGAGRDFAIGAMAKGATAREAVEIASRFSTDCGLGIEEYLISPQHDPRTIRYD